ncbi:MAG: putative metal-binding motif-containing protein [Archangium sp.]|nr:putative metal-binding motif-containing protein [Archangium sp.]
MFRSVVLSVSLCVVACDGGARTCDTQCPASSSCDSATNLCILRSGRDAGSTHSSSSAGGVAAGGTAGSAGGGSAGGESLGGGAAGGESSGGGAAGGESLGGGAAGGEPLGGGSAGGESGGGSAGGVAPVDAGSCTPSLWYRDADHDGFGAPASVSPPVESCVALAGTVNAGTDCDDASPLVNPDALEVCDALLVDENCDGRVNEGCQCLTIGSTQPCCSGRGVQVCVAFDGGARFTDCDAPIGVERCNGLDDDCNALIDDLPRFDGGAPVDGGQVGLSCSVGVGACRRSSTDVCMAAQLFCPVDAGVPSVEQCNGVDDDCNGLVDETSNLCMSIAGQSCVSGACTCPAGQSVCGASCRTLGGSCAAGVGACRRSGVNVCAAAAVVCNATPAQPGVEVCNAIDDDCDGTTDEPGAGLCPASGQTCAAGTCSCPAGQQVCGSACVVLGGACAVGIGVCRNAGTEVCANGAVTCSATPNPPTTEVCNLLDDDCDGAADEAGPNLCPFSGQLCSAGSCSCPAGQALCGGACRALVACSSDVDNDRYRAGTSTLDYCPDAARAAAGFCPPGLVAPSASFGVDCDDASALRYQLVSSRVDVDGDSTCTGPAVDECVGVTPNAQRQFTASCRVGPDDCADGNPATFQQAMVSVDADGDQSCVGSVTSCIGAAPPAGYRFSSSCQRFSDCADTNAAVFQNVVIAADQDGDGFCGTGPMVSCIGSSPPVGFRVAASCNTGTDCDDNNSSRYQILTVRTDQDGDQYCVDSSRGVCAGATPPAGTRLTNNCAGDDCRDTNFLATTTCSLHWSTASANKSCGIGPPPTETFSVSIVEPSQFGCPAGFQTNGIFGAQPTGGNLSGTCSVVPGQPTNITMTCPGGGFGSFSCRVLGTCVAQ